MFLEPRLTASVTKLFHNISTCSIFNLCSLSFITNCKNFKRILICSWCGQQDVLKRKVSAYSSVPYAGELEGEDIGSCVGKREGERNCSNVVFVFFSVFFFSVFFVVFFSVFCIAIFRIDEATREQYTCNSSKNK